MKLQFAERVFEGWLKILNGSDEPAYFLSLLESSSLGKESSDSRFLQTLEPFSLNPLTLFLLASLPLNEFGLSLDDPFPIVVGAGTTDPFSVDNDCDGDIQNSRFQPVFAVHPRLYWLRSAAQ